MGKKIEDWEMDDSSNRFKGPGLLEERIEARKWTDGGKKQQ